nr:MAG: RNA-dependent RNA polymerase [Chemarfal virus 46]
MATSKIIPAIKFLCPVMPKVALVACGAYAGYRCWKLHQLSRQAAFAADLLQPCDSLAEEFVECDDSVRQAWFEDYQREIGEVIMPRQPQDENEDPVPVVALKDSRIEYCSEARKVAEHYTVTERPRYMQAVIAEAKVRFGKPDRTSANVLAVRKFVGDAMRKHRVRPTHVARMAPIVVECVFMESAVEREARDMVEAVHALSGAKWWRTLRWMMGRGYVPNVPFQVA